jgi:octaprenyl-diphosphate synthase
MSIHDIKRPIENELKIFEQKFKEVMQNKVALLSSILSYVVKRKGKQVRPMFVLLSAKLCGGVTEATYHAASLIELLHTATLVHDDVVDDSYERRGFWSINALWKNKIAVLVGDYLLAKGLILALSNKAFRVLEIVTTAVKEMSEGELLQLEKARRLDIKEEIYFEIIRQKTASLIASACSAGAASATDDEERIEKIRLMGEKIGIAFQIRDDLLDFEEDTDIGKPKGIDIKEKKMTLPLIYALNNAPKEVRNTIIRTIKKDSNDPHKVAEVLRFVRTSGGIEYTRQAMYRYRTEALAILASMPDNDARTALEQLVYFVTERGI